MAFKGRPRILRSHSKNRPISWPTYQTARGAGDLMKLGSPRENKDLYCATPTVTRDLDAFCLIRRRPILCFNYDY